MGDRAFAKTDMERVGVFSEPGYISINDHYKGAHAKNFNEAAGKGKQMLPGGSKDRSALQHGYFDNHYGRVFEAEAYSDPVKTRRQQRLKEAQKNIGKPFLPSNGEKKQTGLGNHYGTFSGPISSFSPQGRGKGSYKAPGKNLYTNPGKKGTGFGYVQVTIAPYQKHLTEEFDRAKQLTKKEQEAHRKALKGGAFKLNMHPQSYFDGNPFKSDVPLPPMKSASSQKSDLKPFKPSSPAKKPGGNKSGTFDNYPTHSVDAYGVKTNRPVHVVNKTGKIFMPSAGPKTAPQYSIVNTNVIKTINKTNYKEVSSVVY